MMDRFDAFLAAHGKVLLTTHENPDGDGVGAMVGLAHFLKDRGHPCRIVVSPEIPASLAFIDAQGWVEPFDPQGAHGDLAAWPDAWILVDASDPGRLGPLLKTFQASPAHKACLDHHLKEGPEIGFDASFRDPGASASCELVYTLAAPRMELSRPMALALYAGIVDDTGNFRFSNATPEVHRIAARLIEAGAEPARIYHLLYSQGRVEKVRVTCRALGGMRLDASGRYASMGLSLEDMAACGAGHDELEGLVNRPLEIRGVEVSCLLYERADGRIKASLRSREGADVFAVCRSFGGGGHRLASGATLEGPLEAARALMDAAILARLDVDFPAAPTPSHPLEP
jgi:phosphoesterase RecJ-like protein